MLSDVLVVRVRVRCLLFTEHSSFGFHRAAILKVWNRLKQFNNQYIDTQNTKAKRPKNTQSETDQENSHVEPQILTASSHSPPR